MSDITTLTRPTASGVDLTRSGRWCLAAGLVGVLQGAAMLAWPHQVAASRFSYPQSATWLVVAQATFFLQHLPLAVAVAALAGSSAAHASRWGRRGLVAGSVGLALLALTELVAMTAATTRLSSSLGTAITSLYSVPVLLTGGGLLVAGVALLRSRVEPRRLAWNLTVLGAFVFVGLGPALGTNSFVAGRLAIMAWMLLFALLGWQCSGPRVEPRARPGPSRGRSR